jgi:hypothetical protein
MLLSELTTAEAGAGAVTEPAAAAQVKTEEVVQLPARPQAGI